MGRVSSMGRVDRDLVGDMDAANWRCTVEGDVVGRDCMAVRVVAVGAAAGDVVARRVRDHQSLRSPLVEGFWTVLD